MLLSDKPPKGFEKFFKKKEGRDQKEKKQDDKESKEAQASKKEEKEEELSEEEVDEKPKEKNNSKADGFKKMLTDFYMDPNGKGPKWENIALVALLCGLVGYQVTSKSSSSQEVTYVDFLHQYLAPNKCTMITISEDK